MLIAPAQSTTEITHTILLGEKRFYVPARWIMNPIKQTSPPYDRKAPNGSVFRADRLLQFGFGDGKKTDPMLWPDIAVGLWSLDARPKDLKVRDFAADQLALFKTTGSHYSPPTRPTGRRQNGFIQYPGFWVDANDQNWGTQALTQFYSNPDDYGKNRTFGDRAVLFPVDGIELMYRFDGMTTPQWEWLEMDRRMRKVIEWLLVPPDIRPARIDDLQ